MLVQNQRKPQFDSAPTLLGLGSAVMFLVFGYMILDTLPNYKSLLTQAEGNAMLRDLMPLVVLCACCGIWPLVYFLRTWRAIRLFQEGTTITQATVVEYRQGAAGTGGGSLDTAIVQFDTGNGQVTLKAVVHLAYCQGAKIRIRYTTRDPRVALLEEEVS